MQDHSSSNSAPSLWTGGSKPSQTSHLQTIMAEIVKLLTHFYIPGIDQQIERAMAHDWAVDLSEFSLEAVRGACTSWRRSQTKRPTIAEMRTRCTDEERVLKYRSDSSLEGPYGIGRFPSSAYGEDHVDTYPRSELKAWWQAWKENFPAPVGMPLDDWTECIRSRAAEICPSCTWQMPGEEYAFARVTARRGQM